MLRVYDLYTCVCMCMCRGRMVTTCKCCSLHGYLGVYVCVHGVYLDTHIYTYARGSDCVEFSADNEEQWHERCVKDSEQRLNITRTHTYTHNLILTLCMRPSAFPVPFFSVCCPLPFKPRGQYPGLRVLKGANGVTFTLSPQAQRL